MEVNIEHARHSPPPSSAVFSPNAHSPVNPFRPAAVSKDKVIGIDRSTGLPKLQIEFLPPDGMETEEQDVLASTMPVTKAEKQRMGTKVRACVCV